MGAGLGTAAGDYEVVFGPAPVAAAGSPFGERSSPPAGLVAHWFSRATPVQGRETVLALENSVPKGACRRLPALRAVGSLLVILNRFLVVVF